MKNLKFQQKTNISGNDISKYLVNECEKEDINIYIIEYLIKHGADINKGSEIGNTPLTAACSNRNETVIKYLIKHGAKVDKKNDFDETPLFRACVKGNESLFHY